MTGSGELYLSVLRRIIGPTESLSLLDLCCGEMTHTNQMKFSKSLHVDILDWPTRPQNLEFLCMDVLKCDFPENSFDVVLCSDGLEHFQKVDGLALLAKMEKWAKKVAVIFTPIGDYMINPAANGDPHAHKSGWLPSEFKDVEIYPDWHPTLNLGAFFAWKRK